MKRTVWLMKYGTLNQFLNSSAVIKHRYNQPLYKSCSDRIIPHTELPVISITACSQSYLPANTDHTHYEYNSVDNGTRSSVLHSQKFSNILSRSTKCLVLTPISLIYIYILSSHLPLGLPKAIFSVGSN